MGIFKEITENATKAINLIPQRAPLVMVDDFYGIDNTNSYSSFTIQPDNICVRNNFLQDFGLIEHIAQSAAARVGYLAQQQGSEPPVGFIGSIDNFTLIMLPAAGATLYTRITVEQEFESITLISAATYTSPTMNADTQICSCKMKIFLQQ
ncbi:MAG: hydroxymyristoyl-ACP dehydratase [Bacteroidales bacterium]|jgi:predicted hotdog family 3-hydroxylacyl-ACP dehydratase|nr:hydroxymyristoyl-ACP dehydratase [Bacteroidales bacterium]